MNEVNILLPYYTCFFNYLFFIDYMAQLIIADLLVLTVNYAKILLLFSIKRLLRVGGQNSLKSYFHI